MIVGISLNFMVLKEKRNCLFQMKLKKKLTKEVIEKIDKSFNYDYCNESMVKLYRKIRNGKKQKWIPIFWYCISCKKAVSKF